MKNRIGLTTSKERYQINKSFSLNLFPSPPLTILILPSSKGEACCLECILSTQWSEVEIDKKRGEAQTYTT